MTKSVAKCCNPETPDSYPVPMYGHSFERKDNEAPRIKFAEKQLMCITTSCNQLTGLLLSWNQKLKTCGSLIAL
jgi:hypothetical protein